MLSDFVGSRKDSRGSTALGSWNMRRCYRKRLALLERAGGLPEKCVEVGPGEGHFARLCCAAGIAYRGIERSPALCERLVKEGFDVALGSAPPLPFAEASCDAVILMTVLEHMPTYDLGHALLREANRILRPGGRLVLEVPDLVRCGIAFYAWDYTHSLPMTRPRIEQMLFDTGFEMMSFTRFAASISSRVARWVFDLVGIFVHSRLVYFLAESFGVASLVYAYSKTFQPSMFVVAKRAD